MCHRCDGKRLIITALKYFAQLKSCKPGPQQLPRVHTYAAHLIWHLRVARSVIIIIKPLTFL